MVKILGNWEKLMPPLQDRGARTSLGSRGPAGRAMRGKQANCISHSVGQTWRKFGKFSFLVKFQASEFPLWARGPQGQPHALWVGKEGRCRSSWRPQLGGPALAIGRAHRPNAHEVTEDPDPPLPKFLWLFPEDVEIGRYLECLQKAGKKQ